MTEYELDKYIADPVHIRAAPELFEGTKDALEPLSVSGKRDDG